MTILIYIIIGIVVFIICFAAVYKLNDYLQVKKDGMEIAMNTNTQDEGIGDSHSIAHNRRKNKWEPTHNLIIGGVRLFNLPFVPEKNEIIYLENEYDSEANKFVKENIDIIRERLATRGLTFTYLPELNVSKDKVKRMIAYHSPQLMQGNEITVDDNVSLPSNFLLDYMTHPQNRDKISSSFAWFDHSHIPHGSRKTWHYFCFLAFEGKEALANPLGLINEILPELGQEREPEENWFCVQEQNEDDADTADNHFDEETQKMLEEIQRKLDSIRLKGIAEAVIAKYVRPRPVLSHIRITHDFRIFLEDYNNLEIKMEPLVKAVYILFLRHRDGIAFKELTDYGVELETIYRAIKSKCNDVDKMMASKWNSPVLSPNIQKLINPFDNSINEKCTRIKEAFIVHFHESIAENYFITGGRQANKRIILPRDLIIWEN